MRIHRLAALLGIVALLAACSAGTGTGGQLEGTQWVLHAYDEAGSLTVVPETIFADARFDGHQVSGSSGCNDYTALFDAGDRTILVSNARSTLRACDEATMALEQTYLTLLKAGRFYTARADTLTIFNADLLTILVFDAAPRNPLLGRWDVDSFASAPNTVSAVLPGTTLDVVFGIASIGESAGCNSFNGTYGTNGNVVRVSRLATTQMACPEDVAAQETAFLAALQGASRIDYRGSTLLLTDLSGSVQVALVRPASEEAEASASPSAGPSATVTPSATPGASASAEASATAEPTASPTAKPTASPTPTPTPAPTPSVTPSLRPPIIILPTASCALSTADGTAVATIVYPGAWQTLTEPVDVACRYFDPEPIEVPADGSPIVAAITATTAATPYADAVTAATDPANWTVMRQSESEVHGVTVTCVTAVSLADGSGLPVGTGSASCLVDLGSTGTVTLATTGAPDDPAYAANAAVVGLMTFASTFTPAS